METYIEVNWNFDFSDRVVHDIRENSSESSGSLISDWEESVLGSVSSEDHISDTSDNETVDTTAKSPI